MSLWDKLFGRKFFRQAEPSPRTASTQALKDLIQASGSGRLEVVRALLAAGADVNAKDEDGQFALRLASKNGHLTVAQLLLAAGADIEATLAGFTPLRSACSEGHLEVVKALLAAGADVNAKDEDGEAALRSASIQGHLQVVEALLAAGADVNAAAKNGQTALHAASSVGREAVVRALLAAGADVNATDKYGLTALRRASLGNHQAVVRVLLSAGADADTNPESANRLDELWRVWIKEKGQAESYASDVIRLGMLVGMAPGISQEQKDAIFNAATSKKYKILPATRDGKQGFDLVFFK